MERKGLKENIEKKSKRQKAKEKEGLKWKIGKREERTNRNRKKVTHMEHRKKIKEKTKSYRKRGTETIIEKKKRNEQD